MPGGEVMGLVLCGGLSTRMGRDKSWLRYHGEPQSVHLFRMLRSVCRDVCVSVYPGQAMPEELSPHLIEDQFERIGPAGGLLSAYRRYPERALLVVACDMPHVESANLEALLAARGRDAVAYRATGIEPLLTLWEPTALSALAVNVARGEYSLKHVLENLPCAFLEPLRPLTLRNVNEAREAELLAAPESFRARPLT